MGPAFRHAARVTVRTVDGRTIKREVLNRRGSPENPVTREDVERKFAANLAGLLAPEEIDRLGSLALGSIRSPMPTTSFGSSRRASDMIPRADLTPGAHVARSGSLDRAHPCALHIRHSHAR